MRYTGPTQYLVLLQDAHFREHRFELVVTVKVVLLKFRKITRIKKTCIEKHYRDMLMTEKQVCAVVGVQVLIGGSTNNTGAPTYLNIHCIIMVPSALQDADCQTVVKTS